MLSTCDTEDERRERITASYDYPISACPYGRDWITKLASKRVNFLSLAWTRDNKGYFYHHRPYPTKNGLEVANTGTEKVPFHELYYHFLGTDPSDDILCWRDSKHAQWFSRAEVTADGQYLVLSIEEEHGPVNRVYYCDLSTLPRGLEGLRHSKNNTHL